jgi:hypothetical protein
MFDERDDARNPITFATFSGLSMRPKGICRMRRRVNSCGARRAYDTAVHAQSPDVTGGWGLMPALVDERAALEN